MGKNERKFNIADAKLMEHGEKVAAQLPKDLVDFSQFDSTIVESYPASIKEAIAEVTSQKSNTLIVGKISELTDKLHTIMGKCNSTYRTVMFFVRKVFPNNESIANQFGANKIAKVRTNQSLMIPFMDMLNQSVIKFKDQIIAAGCQESVLAGIPALQKELLDTNTAQEQFKDSKGYETESRIAALNNLYSKLVPLSQIAQIIYADSPARLGMYVLPRPASSTPSNDDLLSE